MKSIIDLIPLFHEFNSVHKEGYFKYPDIYAVYMCLCFYSPVQDDIVVSLTDFTIDI